MTEETAAKTEYEQPEHEQPEIVSGLEEVARGWWAAVIEVHEVLLRGDADIDTVSTAFNNELQARWEYARTLHEHGYRVPDYLAERATVAPTWPLPEVPKPVRQVPRAA